MMTCRQCAISHFVGYLNYVTFSNEFHRLPAEMENNIKLKELSSITLMPGLDYPLSPQNLPIACKTYEICATKQVKELFQYFIFQMITAH